MIIKIFEQGDYPQGSWPIERIKKLVKSYDPVNKTEAPGVVGHMGNFTERIENELAYCWVKSISFNELGEVWADVPNETVVAQLRTWLIEGSLKYISCEIAVPDEEKGREKESPYLLRIAFLGRSIPAVPTTRIPSMFKRFASMFTGKQFEEDQKTFTWCGRINESAIDELIEFCVGSGKVGPLPEKINNNTHNSQFSEDDEDEETDGNNGADGLENTGGEEPMTDEEKQEFENLKAKNAALEVQNKALKTKADKFDKQEIDNRLAALVDDGDGHGKMSPAQYASIKDSIHEMDEKSREILFKSWEGAPSIVALGSESVAVGPGGKTNFSDNLPEQIQRYAAENKLSYEVAAEKLYAENPKLFESESSVSVTI